MIITITTDFGLSDSYVGVMKGVILGICPEVRIVDITHDLPPQDVLAGALAIEQALPYFPPGTIHIVVVDPGVGSERRPIAVATPRATLVGPDNGVFSLALDAAPIWRAVHLNDPAYWLPHVSHTFHGRDIFSPVAAHLAGGLPIDRLGTATTELVRIDVPAVQRESLRLLGTVLQLDRFGNCICTITARDLAALNARQLRVRVGGRELGPLRRTYADVAEGEPLAYVGSDGRLEIAVRNRNAAKELGIWRGTPVEVYGE